MHGRGIICGRFALWGDKARMDKRLLSNRDTCRSIEEVDVCIVIHRLKGRISLHLCGMKIANLLTNSVNSKCNYSLLNSFFPYLINDFVFELEISHANRTPNS